MLECPGENRGIFVSVLSPTCAAFYFSCMVEMNLYQPGVINATIQFPSEWNDLSLEELHLVAKSILSNFKDGAEAAVALFLGILKIRCKKVCPDIDRRLDAEDAYINGMPATDFIYRQNNLTRQPYPTVKIPWPYPGSPFKRTMYGLQDDFNNITCGEFEDADIYFQQFRQDPSGDAAANLAAILYRPKGRKYMRWSWFKGEYIVYDAEKMAPLFKKLKAWELYSMFMWYAGCREQLPKIFPNCFTGSAPKIDDVEAEPDLMLFTKIIHAGAGPENGDRNQIRRTLLKEFFMDLELKNIANQELKAQLDAK